MSTQTRVPAVPAETEGAVAEVLVARGIVKSFGPHRVLDEVDLSIRAGETVALVGESGSGKSTFGRILVGLERPDAGTILADGVPVNPGPRAGVGMIFQDPYDSIDPRMNVRRIVGEPLGRRATDQRVRDMLDDVGLDVLGLTDRVDHLSGGQRQRLCIARALIADPGVLVCDEATAALDAVTRTRVLDLLLRLQADRGIGMLFITHDLDVATRFADRISVLESGRIVEEGPAETVGEAPQHPYSQRLFASALAGHPSRRRVQADAVAPRSGTTRGMPG
jgi:peptide/nickel transport system ATP-binding protein